MSILALLVRAFFVLGELIGQDLDRHVPAEFGILRPIDLSHPSLANRLDDLVMGEFMTSLEGHGVNDVTTMVARGQLGIVAGKWV